MTRPRAADRLNRRRLLTGAAALAAAGLALPLTRRAARVQADDDPQTIEIPIPPNIRARERWVDVNLSAQVAVAMLGRQAVRAILVTTGMPGWDTPAGQFEILTRVADERMASSALGIPIDSVDGYDLDHVLWTQYFTDQGHALHDNYWRPLSVFGHEATSHGCVGMVEDDAHFLWGFVGVGSLVNIHY
jgi:lipoprotein-anchoring transpeptidase ErfK/SrfK